MGERDNRLIGLAFAGLASLALGAAACAAPSPDLAGGSDRVRGQLTFGELVFGIVRTNVADSEACSEERVSTLDSRRDEFVSAVDYVVTHDIVQEFPDLLASSLLPVIDNGDLPQATDALAKVVALLVDDTFDPERKTLGVLADAANSPNTIDTDAATELARRVIADPALKDRVLSLVELANAETSREHVLDGALDVASRVLSYAATDSTCGDVTFGDLETTWLATEGFERPARDTSPRAWVVRRDIHQNPRVRVDPNTGTLYPPFVDVDADKVADVDSDEHPVDATGARIDLAAFGTTGSRDRDKLALAPDGLPIYAYYDAKETALADALTRVHSVLVDGDHAHIIDVLEAALGPQSSCTDCPAYNPADYPLADLAFVVLELAKYPKLRVFVRTWAETLEERPQDAEKLLATVGSLLGEIKAADVKITDPELRQLGTTFIPLVGEIFSAHNSSGQSTPRLLLDVISDLGEVSRDFPHKLDLSIQYSTLYKRRSCSADEPDLSRSTPVNFDEPRFVRTAAGTRDNRSSIEQSVELLANADCGSVPFSGGKTVAHVLIDLLAGASADTTCGLIDAFLGLINVIPSAGEFITSGALDLIGCDGDRVYQDLEALDSLAKSGALDFYLPIAKLFRDRGQLGTLIELLNLVAADLKKDEDGSATTSSAVRKFLPIIHRLVESGAADTLFDLNDTMLAVRAAEGDGNLADLSMDTLGYVVTKQVTLPTRTGHSVYQSPAGQLLLDADRLLNRVNAAGADDDVEALLDVFSNALKQDPSNPHRLQDQQLVALINVVLKTGGQLAANPDETWECYISSVEDTANDALQGEGFAKAMRILSAFRNSPERPALEQWLIELTDPSPTDRNREIRGLLLQVLASAVERDGELPEGTGSKASILASFLSRATTELRTDGDDLLTLVRDLLLADENNTFMTMAQSLLTVREEWDRTPLGSVASPLSAVAQQDARSMCIDTDRDITATDLADTVEAVVEFMQDDTRGLGGIYDLIGRRSRDVSP